MKWRDLIFYILFVPLILLILVVSPYDVLHLKYSSVFPIYYYLIGYFFFILSLVIIDAYTAYAEKTGKAVAFQTPDY